jgi:hypothetical protein
VSDKGENEVSIPQNSPQKDKGKEKKPRKSAKKKRREESGGSCSEAELSTEAGANQSDRTSKDIQDSNEDCQNGNFHHKNMRENVISPTGFLEATQFEDIFKLQNQDFGQV